MGDGEWQVLEGVQRGARAPPGVRAPITTIIVNMLFAVVPMWPLQRFSANPDVVAGSLSHAP